MSNTAGVCAVCDKEVIHQSRVGGTVPDSLGLVVYPGCGHAEHFVCANNVSRVCFRCNTGKDEFSPPLPIAPPPTDAESKAFHLSTLKRFRPADMREQQRTGELEVYSRVEKQSLATATIDHLVDHLLHSIDMEKKDHHDRDGFHDDSEGMLSVQGAVNSTLLALSTGKDSPFAVATANATTGYEATGVNGDTALSLAAHKAASNVSITEESLPTTGNELLYTMGQLKCLVDACRGGKGGAEKLDRFLLAMREYNVTFSSIVLVLGDDANKILSKRGGFTLASCIDSGIITKVEQMALLDRKTLLPFLRGNVSRILDIGGAPGNDKRRQINAASLWTDVFGQDLVALADSSLSAEELKSIITPEDAARIIKRDTLSWDMFAYLGEDGMAEWGLTPSLLRKYSIKGTHDDSSIEATLQAKGWNQSQVAAFIKPGQRRKTMASRRQGRPATGLLWQDE